MMNNNTKLFTDKNITTGMYILFTPNEVPCGGYGCRAHRRDEWKERIEWRM
jgi:hypothetical protein